MSLILNCSLKSETPLFYRGYKLWNNSIINNPLHDIEKSVSLLDLEIEEMKSDTDMALASKDLPGGLDETDITIFYQHLQRRYSYNSGLKLFHNICFFCMFICRPNYISNDFLVATKLFAL